MRRNSLSGLPLRRRKQPDGRAAFSGISPEAMYQRLHQKTEIVQLTEGDDDDLLDGTGFEALNPEILPKGDLDED